MDGNQPGPRGHTRNKSGARPSRPRSSTKGPLDAADNSLVTTEATGSGSSGASTPRLAPRPLHLQPSSGLPSRTLSPQPPPAGAASAAAPHLVPPSMRSGSRSPGPPPAVVPAKDFSYLLRPDIYHPLSTASVPAAFRADAAAAASSSSSVAAAPFDHLLPQPTTPLADLVARGHFRAAAVAAAQELTGATAAAATDLLLDIGEGDGGPPEPVDPTDHARIFGLLYARLACLTLVGAAGESGTALAAQEAKALQDLGSAFYYADPPVAALGGAGSAAAAAAAAAAGATTTHLAPNPLLSPSAPIPSPAFPPPSMVAPTTTTAAAATQSRSLPTVPPLPSHLVPWDLRVLAVRLSGLGFGDARRAVMSYHELAREARARIAALSVALAPYSSSPSSTSAVSSPAPVSAEEGNSDEAKAVALLRGARRAWRARLAGLGLRVAGAMVEMGDLAGAAELMARLDGEATDGGGGGDSGGEDAGRLAMCRALLWLHVGDAEAARKCVAAAAGAGEEEEGGKAAGGGYRAQAVRALADMADGEYAAALGRWRALREEMAAAGGGGGKCGGGVAADEMVGINLAVCLLYVGRMEEGRAVLESLVSSGYASHTLLFNLTTMYELCTDRPRALKLRLTEQVAAIEPSARGWEKTNADFKL